MTHHILVVDDEPDLQHFIELVFKKKIRRDEYQFSFALNGKDALSIIENNPDIHMVITDLNMPEMDGIALLRQIKALNRLIKPVIISAYGDIPNIRAAMNHGAFDFLIKPIDLQDLEITVNRTLEEVAILKQAMQDRNNLIAIERELDIAHHLQASMMPKVPKRFGEFIIDGQILLSEKVGGDFWDLIPLNDREALVVFGDSSGHGLSAALIMSAIRHSLHALASQTKDFYQFIEPLNTIIYEEFKTRSRYATMIFAHLRVGDPTVRYLRAGHELLLHRHKGHFLLEDWRGGLPVGLFPLRQGDEWVEIELAPGDEVYLYSDGIVDGLPGKTPKIVPLLESIEDLVGTLEAHQFFQVLAENYRWTNLDDASMLMLRLNHTKNSLA